MGNAQNNKSESNRLNKYQAHKFWFDENRKFLHFAKHGIKVTSSRIVSLAMDNSNISSSKITKFLHSQRRKLYSLRNMTAIIDKAWLMPFLISRLSLRSFLKSFSKNLSGYKYLQRFKLRCAKLEGIDITQQFWRSLSKLKKLKTISIDVNEYLERNKMIAKAIKRLKYLSRLDLNFLQKTVDLYETVQVIKSCSGLEVLRLDLSGCKFDSNSLIFIHHLLKSLAKLQFFILNLNNTAITDYDLNSLVQAIDSQKNLQYAKVYIEGCSNIPWFKKAYFYAKGNFDKFSKIC